MFPIATLARERKERRDGCIRHCDDYRGSRFDEGDHQVAYFWMYLRFWILVLWSFGLSKETVTLFVTNNILYFFIKCKNKISI